MKSRTAVLLLLVGAVWSAPARAQSIAAEADLTVGRSSEDVNAAAVQLRLFGASKSDWRFFVEGAWGRVAGAGSDAFAAAYPYDRRVRPIEAYAEKIFHPGAWLLGVRAGRYRMPFGISGRSDHAYTGFVRAPLIRYSYNWALSNTYMEAGADVLVGTPSVQLEASVGVPSDEGAWRRRRGLDVVARAQTYHRSLILGASVVHTRPSDPGKFAQGRMVFHGIDARWMHGGVQLRGEWVFGRAFDGVATKGGYLDALVHHMAMGPVTAVARIERLDYDAGEHSEYLRRFTAGARVRLTSALVAQLNLIRQPGGLAKDRDTAFDLGLTYTLRF